MLWASGVIIWPAVVIGLPSTALVVQTLACEQAFRKLGQPAKATIDFLGELSYPIYIFHIYVMGAVKRLGALQFSLPVYTAIVFAATLTVAAAVYVLYEKPVRAFLSRHLLHGVEELLTAKHAVLEEVAHSAAPVLHEFAGVEGFDVLREHQHRQPGAFLAGLDRDSQSLVGERRG